MAADMASVKWWQRRTGSLPDRGVGTNRGLVPVEVELGRSMGEIGGKKRSIRREHKRCKVGSTEIFQFCLEWE
jgi:hypothetical protein